MRIRILHLRVVEHVLAKGLTILVWVTNKELGHQKRLYAPIVVISYFSSIPPTLWLMLSLRVESRLRFCMDDWRLDLALMGQESICSLNWLNLNVLYLFNTLSSVDSPWWGHLWIATSLAWSLCWTEFGSWFRLIIKNIFNLSWRKVFMSTCLSHTIRWWSKHLTPRGTLCTLRSL